MENKQSNPLQKYFRQPKLYIKLPSSGAFYPEGSLEKTQNEEYPVYAMTARDELVLKTPDALLNGQSTVDVIHSCIPNIKNAWDVPTIDLDAILIAIRIATYGESMDLMVTLPNTDIVKEFTTDLRISLETLLNSAFDSSLKLNDDITIDIRPLNYNEYTKNAIKVSEEQRMLDLVNNKDVDSEEKVKRYNEIFQKLTDINIGSIIQTVDKIRTPDGVVTNRDHISEFISKSEKEVFDKIVKHLESQREKFQLKPFKVQTTEEEQTAGAPAEFETPLVLDAASFFG